MLAFPVPTPLSRPGRSDAGGDVMKHSEIISRVIAEASAIHAWSDAEWRKLRRGRRSILASEVVVPPPPGSQELKDYLKSLPPATIYTLAVIMYLGRGDY